MPEKEEGVVYVSSSGSYFTAPEIIADKLRDFQSNLYGKGLSRKQKNLIFTDKYSLEVLDNKGEPDDDLQKTLFQMCEDKNVRLWTNMQRSYEDIFWYGEAIFNPVWGYENNEYRLQKLRHLPAYTFRMAPDGTDEIYSQILQGIILKNSEIEFHQVNNEGVTTEIKNIFYVKDPTASGLGGESIILPLVPIFEMLKYTWNAQMQQVQRTGAKILFIKVTAPEKASPKNGNVGDVAYANLLLKKWGKDTAFQFRENMELINPGIKDDASNLEVIEALNRMVIDYVTPTSFIAREGGIGGTERQREELLLKYISGIHTWLEDQFEMLLNRYLEYNEYVGYTLNLHIPSPSIDKSEIELKQAVEGFKAQALTVNEIRERLGAKGLEEEEINALIEHYKTIAPKPATFEMQVTETPKKVEKSMENELEEAANQLAENVLKSLEKEE